MIFTAIDVWIGKSLFTPLIIKVCQLTRQSQFAVSRLFWFVAALDGFYRAETLLWSVIWGVMSLFMMVTASMRADSPTQSLMSFRLLSVAFFGLDVLKGIVTGVWAGCEFWLFVLIAEYAATIRTIPPRETTRTERKVTSLGS
jgi:hypothetical protein